MGLDPADGILKHGSVDGGNVLVETESSADYAGKVNNDPVIACSGVVGEF